MWICPTSSSLMINACTSSTKSMPMMNRPWRDLFSEFVWKTTSLKHASFKKHTCPRVSLQIVETDPWRRSQWEPVDLDVEDQHLFVVFKLLA